MKPEYMLILSILVPYVTAAIKKGLQKLRFTYPMWFKPIRPILAGVFVAALSKAFGVELPSDLMQVTDVQISSVITSGVFMGGAGVVFREVANSVKKEFGPETRAGLLVRLIAGQEDPK